MTKKHGMYTPRRRKTPTPSPSPSPSSAKFYTDGDGVFKGWIVEHKPRKSGRLAGTIDKKYIDPEKKYKFSTKKAALEYLETGKIRSCAGPGRNFNGTPPLPSAKRQKVSDSQIGSESSNSHKAAKDKSPSLLPFENVSGACRTTSPAEDQVKEDERVSQQLGSEEKRDFTLQLPFENVSGASRTTSPAEDQVKEDYRVSPELGSEEKCDFTPLLPKQLLLGNDEMTSLQPPCQATLCSCSHSVFTQVKEQGELEEEEEEEAAKVNEEGSLKQVLKGLFSLPKAVYNWYFENPSP